MRPIFGQSVSPFRGPAYQYVRESDRLPTTDEAYDQEDPLALVKLFTPDGAATWYIAGVDEDGIAFGAADLGFDCCEMGDFTMTEIIALRGKFGLPVERDLGWAPKRLSELIR